MSTNPAKDTSTWPFRPTSTRLIEFQIENPRSVFLNISLEVLRTNVLTSIIMRTDQHLHHFRDRHVSCNAAREKRLDATNVRRVPHFDGPIQRARNDAIGLREKTSRRHFVTVASQHTSQALVINGIDTDCLVPTSAENQRHFWMNVQPIDCRWEASQFGNLTCTSSHQLIDAYGLAASDEEFVAIFVETHIVNFFRPFTFHFEVTIGRNVIKTTSWASNTAGATRLSFQSKRS